MPINRRSILASYRHLTCIDPSLFLCPLSISLNRRTPLLREAYDGIPEIVESIQMQATGVAEASRAIRKKLKHGDTHQQYRALVILRALVENGGPKFQTSFADSQLLDAIKSIAHDPTTDPRVRKRLLSVVASWHAQFKDDPSMATVSNLYRQCKPADSYNRHRSTDPVLQAAGLDPHGEYERRKLEERERERERKERKEEEKRKAKEAKEKARAGARRQAKSMNKRKPFNFEQERPQILTTIANASQASNNLVNAITLVNTEHDSLQANERVQECLQNAKVARKQIVRYVQLVENEDMIGTLIDTNERIIAALDMYDTLSKPQVTEKDVQDVQEGLAAVKIHDSELGKLQEKQRAAVQRSLGRAGGGKERDRATYEDDDEFMQPRSASSETYVHPDLQELSFGSLGAEQRNLPPPLRPSTRRSSSEDEDQNWRHGSLSDFSDYESSDEDTHNRASASGSAHTSTSAAQAYASKHQHGKPSTGSRRDYVNVSDDDEVDVRKDPKKGLLSQEEDPFADPFAD
ncbi:unnamed protein product [Somion occarium]|uniref:VHS domain-containing protein n=1 Tax=Somion occarium TaxID=3059160 RepID=A0ABP1CER1_9APHY